MQRVRFHSMFLVSFFLLAISACKKDLKSNDVSSADLPEHFSSRNNKCLLTYTNDGTFGFVINVSYNQEHNPDIVQINALGQNMIGKYDSRGRLRNIYYSFWQDREDFVYSNNSDLPSKIYYYVPNYADYGMTDSLNAIISFKYNQKGEMTQLKYVNYWYPDNNYINDYSYNSHSNLISVSENPLMPSGFIPQRYDYFSYDNKPNIFSGNPWLKYFLFSQSVDACGNIPMLSTNNPDNWSWKYDPSFPGYHFNNVGVVYNQKGFANDIPTNVFDSSSNSIFTLHRFSASECDGENKQAITSDGNKQTIFKNSSSMNKYHPAL